MGTDTALIQFVDFIRQGLSDKNNVGAIFMDLSKAFDLMDHHILKSKLENYGFRGYFLDFLMSFFLIIEKFLYMLMALIQILRWSTLVYHRAQPSDLYSSLSLLMIWKIVLPF